MAINIAVFCTRHSDRNDGCTRFHGKECRAFATVLQPAADRLPALWCQPDHASLFQSIQCGAQCAAVWSAAVYPDDAIGTENRTHARVIVQFNLSHSVNCGGDGGGYQNCICIPQMINDDQCRSALREVFQAADYSTHRKKCDQLCKPT